MCSRRRRAGRSTARITVTTADTSLAAGEYLYLRTRIEGSEVADFRWGSGNAKQATLRFLFKGPAGTYAVSLTNSAANRSHVATFSPAADTDQIISLAIPGDTSGAWLTDTGIGIEVRIALACGSTFQGTAGWQSGNILGTSAVSNGMGIGSAVFELGEFGLYLDSDATGVAPTWELPSLTDELARCQRYYEKSLPLATAPGTSGTFPLYVLFRTTSAGSFGGALTSFAFAVKKRAGPTLTLYSDTGAANRVRVNGSSDSANYLTAVDASAFRVWNNGALSGDGDACWFDYVADARL